MVYRLIFLDHRLRFPTILTYFVSYQTLLKNHLLCLDIEKEIIQYKDKNNKIKRDDHLKKITDMLYNVLDMDGYTKSDQPQIHEKVFREKFIKNTCERTFTAEDSSTLL